MEKKLTLRTSYLFLIFLIAFALPACQPKGEKTSQTNARTDSLEKSTKSLKPFPKQEGFHTVIKQDSTIQKIIIDGKLHFESLILGAERKQNYLYPKVSDSFLFEDKYYLKLSYPVPFSGTIKTTIPDRPDYVLTPIGEDVLQVVVYNALDLKIINFNLNYKPSENDSLISSTYPFKYVVYN